MLSFRVLVPGVTEYTGTFAGQRQAALDAEGRYPDAPPACTFVLTPTPSRRRNLQVSQLLEPLAVSVPVGLAVCGKAAIVVEVNAVDVLASHAVHVPGLDSCQFSLEADPHRVFVVVDVIRPSDSDRLVSPVCHHVAAVFLLDKAVRQKQPSETGELIGHNQTPFKNHHSDRTAGLGENQKCRGASPGVRLQKDSGRLASRDADHTGRAAPDARLSRKLLQQQARTFPTGVTRLARNTSTLTLAAVNWALAAGIALLLSVSYLLDSPSETQAAQDVADEAAYAAAVADGGAAQCAASGRVPLWTPNGDLICRLPKRPTVLAQGSRP